jgi:DnaJ family protein C protein 17
MADQDLITYARDAAARGDDLFALLATDATASESDIRRAFRRKALTAHPDKAGDAYDPALYERLERARDVLVSPEAREAYDTGMRAILQKKLQREQMTDKRRRLVEDLERREAEAKRVKTAGPQAGPQDAERRAMAERGRAKMEEMRRLREQAEVRERLAKEKEEAAAAAAAAAVADTGEPDTGKAAQGGRPTPPAADDYDERIAELEMRLKESQQRKAEKQQRKEERKAEKKGKTGKKAGSPPAPGSPGEKIPDNPPPSTAAEPQADEDKLSKPAEAASLAPQPGAGDPPKASDRFASTLARLRAAQAKKDEEKKRKAAE